MSKKGINVDEYIDKVINNWLIEDKRISYLEIDDIENIIINKINEITNND